MTQFDLNTSSALSEHLLVTTSELEEVIRHRYLYYRNSQLPKKNGGFRVLKVPHGLLKKHQGCVKRLVLDAVKPLPCVHGGVVGRSVVTNAKPHVGKNVVFKLDVQDFFPSVRATKVRSIFGTLGFGQDAIDALVALTTWDDQLPQGAATSVGLANLAMYKADVRLARLAEQQGFDYTRYIDDLTVSGSWRLLKFRKLIQRIIEEEGFVVNLKKLKTMTAGSRQEVTGLIVNEKLNLPKERRDVIRREVAQISSRHNRRAANQARVRGQLSWLSSVNPRQAVRLRIRAGV